MFKAKIYTVALGLTLVASLSCNLVLANPISTVTPITVQSADEKAVIAIFTGFQESIISGDSGKFLNSIVDSTNSEQIAKAKSLKSNTDYKYSIGNIRKQDENTYEVALSSSSLKGTYPSITYEVKKENGSWKVDNMGYYFLNKSEVTIDPQVISAAGMKKVAGNDDFEVYKSSISSESIKSSNLTESNLSSLAATTTYGPYTVYNSKASAKIYCNGNVSINFFYPGAANQTVEVIPSKYDQQGNPEMMYNFNFKSGVETMLPTKFYGYHSFEVFFTTIKQPSGTFTVTTY